MKTAMKFLVGFLCTLPFAASADWNLLIAPANVQTELAAPGVLEMRVSNTGTDASPAMDLQAGAIAALLGDYQVDILSGGCGPWRVEIEPFGFPFQRAFARIAIPALAPGSSLQCRYDFIALRTNSQNHSLSFAPSSRPNAPNGLIHIGALTDLGATANLLSSRIETGQAVNRYRINVHNFGPNSVANYGFGTCTSPPIGFSVRVNFPGACPVSNVGPPCFMSGFAVTAGAVQANQSASCEIETIGASNPSLGLLRLVEFSVTRSDGRQLLDTNPSNNAVRIVAGAAAVEVTTLSWLGLIALIFGVALVAQNRDFVSKSES
jgi:hypothetical protein